MLNGDFCVQVTGKPVGNLPGYPVLTKWGLNKNIGRQYKEQQGEEEPE